MKSWGTVAYSKGKRGQDRSMGRERESLEIAVREVEGLEEVG